MSRLHNLLSKENLEPDEVASLTDWLEALKEDWRNFGLAPSEENLMRRLSDKLKTAA
jgi:hypothetical protein